MTDPSTLSDTDQAAINLGNAYEMGTDFASMPALSEAQKGELLAMGWRVLRGIYTPEALSDADLLAEFHRVEWLAGEPVHEALLAEVRRRALDF